MKPGYKTTEFYLMLISLLFAIWAGYYTLTTPDVELERFSLILGAIAAFAGIWTQQRTSLKKERQDG